MTSQAVVHNVKTKSDVSETQSSYPPDKEYLDSEQIKVDIKDMYDPRSPYMPEDKVRAVAAYVVTGTSKQASKQTGIPAGTIRYWKNNALWWNDLTKEVRTKKNEELDGIITGTMHGIMSELEDRIKNGDVKLSKTGEQLRVPMSGKELALTFAILHDKRAMLRGDPTSRTEQITSKDVLENIRKEFEEVARTVQGGTVTIEGETTYYNDKEKQ